MFDALRETLKAYNVFDLREPQGFRFFSLQGFGVYIVAYVLLVAYTPLFSSACLPKLGDWSAIAQNCGVKPRALVFQFVFMIVAFAGAATLRKRDWSTDALFNHISALIVCCVGVTALLYTAGQADWVQEHDTTYFLCLSGALLGMLSILSLLPGAGPDLGTKVMASLRTLEFYRLLALYWLPAVAYLMLAFLFEDIGR